MAVVLGVGIAVAANAIAAGFSDVSFSLSTDVVWSGIPYFLIAFCALFGYLGRIALGQDASGAGTDVTRP
ncbi:MAG TPA: hypothetical protein VKB70_04850 [Gaiellaceae bacterium]|nr:hypothetical protein [Gaiellaceae bacterium]